MKRENSSNDQSPSRPFKSRLVSGLSLLIRGRRNHVAARSSPRSVEYEVEKESLIEVLGNRDVIGHAEVRNANQNPQGIVLLPYTVQREIGCEVLAEPERVERVYMNELIADFELQNGQNASSSAGLYQYEEEREEDRQIIVKKRTNETPLAVETSSAKRGRRHPPDQRLPPSKPLDLPLPHKFNILLRIFQKIDMILQLKRSSSHQLVLNFNDLKYAMHRMMPELSFRLRYLAMIRNVFPQAYQYGLVDIPASASLNALREGDVMVRPGERKHLTVAFGSVDDGMGSEYIVGGHDIVTSAPTLLHRRYMIFRELLLKLAINIHAEYCDKKGVNSSTELVEKTKRWHPEFDLTLIKFPNQAEMPELRVESLVSTGERLYRLAERIQSSRTRKAVQRASGYVNLPAPPANRTSTPVLEHKGIPEDVLNAVKQREAESERNRTWHESEEYQEQKLYKKLTRVAQAVFNSFGKREARVLGYHQIEQDVRFELEWVTGATFAHFMKLIIENFPFWLRTIVVRDAEYYKMDKAIQRTEFKKFIQDFENKLPKMLEERRKKMGFNNNNNNVSTAATHTQTNK